MPYQVVRTHLKASHEVVEGIGNQVHVLNEVERVFGEDHAATLYENLWNLNPDIFRIPAVIIEAQEICGTDEPVGFVRIQEARFGGQSFAGWWHAGMTYEESEDFERLLAAQSGWQDERAVNYDDYHPTLGRFVAPNTYMLETIVPYEALTQAGLPQVQSDAEIPGWPGREFRIDPLRSFMDSL